MQLDMYTVDINGNKCKNINNSNKGSFVVVKFFHVKKIVNNNLLVDLEYRSSSSITYHTGTNFVSYENYTGSIYVNGVFISELDRYIQNENRTIRGLYGFKLEKIDWYEVLIENIIDQYGAQEFASFERTYYIMPLIYRF